VILSPDCRDGNYTKCPGDAWDETHDGPAVCQHPSHHPDYTEAEVIIAHVIADAKDDYAQVDHRGPNNMDLLAGRAVVKYLTIDEGEARGTDS
jgi:hypothetical protein